MNWSDHPILDFPEIDTQHRYLYGLFDLIDSDGAKSNPAAMRALLNEIERNLLLHFSYEEQLMRSYGFAGFAVHQSDHERGGAKFVDFMDDFDAGSLNPTALRIFLTGWLMEHSSISDIEYVAWIKSRRTAVHMMLPTK